VEIPVKDLDHLGIIVGIIDQIGLVKEIDQVVGKHPQQKVSTGQALKTQSLHLDSTSFSIEGNYDAFIFIIP